MQWVLLYDPVHICLVLGVGWFVSTIACSDELLTSQLTFCSVKAQRGTHCKDRKIKISLRSDDEVNAVNCSPRGH